jgi:putative tryptophan/tyrosine transport system substrate-binding protein
MRRRDAFAAMLSLGAAVLLSACEEQTKPPGRTWHVGLLLTGLTEDAVASQRRVIVERLAQHGFVEGRNLRVELRRGGYIRTDDAVIARELVARQPDAILVDTSPLAMGTREATNTIPIVFTGVADPVGAGLIKDFAHPGGNATGVHFSQLGIASKRVELLRELLPGARRVLVVRHLGGPESDVLPHLHREASRLGIEIVETDAKWGQGFVAPPASSGTPDAMYSGEPWMIYGAEDVADQIIRFAAEKRIPSLFWEAAAAERGATLAYGVNVIRELGRAADQLARVLKGAKPGELPVDTSTEYELVVNKKAAAAIGIPIPASIIARANRVIE